MSNRQRFRYSRSRPFDWSVFGPPEGLQNPQVIQKGLKPERIQKFHHFEADESHTGGQCSICREDIEIGRKLMRLDCDGQHVFCKVCIEKWFTNHKTCPNCRQTFS